MGTGERLAQACELSIEAGLELAVSRIVHSQVINILLDYPCQDAIVSGVPGASNEVRKSIAPGSSVEHEIACDWPIRQCKLS
jgi:hypothetical protein